MKWKELAPAERDEFATTPRQFAEWCDQLHLNINPALRNTPLYLVFPDSFEDILVQGDKDNIVKRHYDKMTKQSIPDFLAMEDSAVECRSIKPFLKFGGNRHQKAGDG
jgi:hypothetical protein